MASKISSAQLRALMTGFTNEKGNLTGRPASLSVLVREGLAVHLVTIMKTRWTEEGRALAEEHQAAERAEQFNADAAAVESHRPEGTRPVYARDLQPGMLISTGTGFRSVEAIDSYEKGPYAATHWTRVILAPAVERQGMNDRAETSNPTFIYFVAEIVEEKTCPGCGVEAGKPCKDPLLDLLNDVPRPRPAAEVLAADPIPVDTSVLEGMPGERIGRDGVSVADALKHENYVAQLRNKGAWILPNHDDQADMTWTQVVTALAYVRCMAPNWGRAAVDTDGTIYVSDGRQAARYIPAELIADYSADFCPGCGTLYAVNGDGPCSGGNSVSSVVDESKTASDFPAEDLVKTFRVTIDQYHKNGGRIGSGTVVVEAPDKQQASEKARRETVVRMIEKNAKAREEMARTGVTWPLASEDPDHYVVVDVRRSRKGRKAGA